MDEVVEYRTFSWPRLVLAVAVLLGGIVASALVIARSGAGYLLLATALLTGGFLVGWVLDGHAAAGAGTITECFGGWRRGHTVRTADLVKGWVHTPGSEGGATTLCLADRHGTLLQFSAERLSRRPTLLALRVAVAAEVLGSPAELTEAARAVLLRWQERVSAI